MSTMTTATFHHRKPESGRVRPRTGRVSLTAIDVIAASAHVIRPVLLGVTMFAVALTFPNRAHADPGDTGSAVLNSIGMGNGGPISSVISEVGTSFCPLLVQPGSALASNATQLSGNGGVAPPIAGWVAGMAIQSQCPAVVNALANGDLAVLTGGAGAPSVPGLAGLPGAQPAPLGVPGLPTNPLAVPGL